MKVAVILASLCLMACVTGAPTNTASTTAATVVVSEPNTHLSSDPPVSDEALTTVTPTLVVAAITDVLPTEPTVVSSKTTTTESSTNEEDYVKIIVTKDFFVEDYLFYGSQYDIVSIVIPINGLNFPENEDEDDDDKESVTIFFVEADVKDGKKDYKGLYLHNRNTSKLILANGRDVASSINNKSKDAYIAADDGIYFFDVATTSASKYGSFDKSVFAIAKPNGTDDIYVLTDDKDLYKVSNEGNTAEKIDAIKNAEAIVIDSGNNLYFYTAGNSPRVYNGKDIKEFPELPSNPKYVALVRPSFIADDETIVAVVDDKAYILHSNGTSIITSFEFKVHPTAYGMEAGLIQYYAYEKKIYEYHFLDMISGGIINNLKEFADSKAEDIQRYASKPRSAFNRR